LFINYFFQSPLKTATDCCQTETDLMQRDTLGLCAHSTCRWTVPARQLYANDWEWTTAN